MNKASKLFGALAAVALSASLSAATIDFTGDAGAGSIGNQLNFSGGGVTVQVKAFSRTSATSGGFSNAAVGQYGPGLGVINDFGFFGWGGDGDHEVDNIGNLDYLLFSFSAPVSFTGIRLEAVGADGDFDYWIGNSSSASSLYSGTKTSVEATGANEQDRLLSGTGQYLLIGAATLPTNDLDDTFKVRSLTFSNPPTNTPGVPDGGATVILLGASLAGLGLVARRRKL
jgi:hypothetical protein